MYIHIYMQFKIWSGIMVSDFVYGSETASSTAVEFSFKKRKTITFRQELLPVNIEEFLQQHITSNHGASLIHSSKLVSSNMAINEENIENVINKHDENILSPEKDFKSTVI